MLELSDATAFLAGNRFEPKVSVVMPAFNRAQSIRRALDSVLDQTWKRLEVVVVDDASTDETWQILETYTDERLSKIRLPVNNGGGHARNVGIDTAGGDFIAFLDSDDFWKPDKIEKQLAAVKQREAWDLAVVYNKIGLIIGEHIYYTPQYPWTKDIKIDEYIVPRKQYMQTSGLLVSASLAKQVRFDERLRKYQDIDFILNLHRHSGVFIFCDAPTVYYSNTTRQGRVSTSADPEPTLTLLEKWGDAISANTRSYYLTTTVAPIYLRTNFFRAIKYYFMGMPQCLKYTKDIVEGIILWNFSTEIYDQIRARYRRLFRK